MKNQYIVERDDAGQFLDYCVSWGIKATVVNKVYASCTVPARLVFKVNKPLSETDFNNIKSNSPSFQKYEPFKMDVCLK